MDTLPPPGLIRSALAAQFAYAAAPDPNRAGFFAPVVLQREYAVARRGDTVSDRRVSHLGTEFVSSCLVLVLYDPAGREAGIAHLDDAADAPATVKAMRQEFQGRPGFAVIAGTDYLNNVPHLKMLFTALTGRAPASLDELEPLRQHSNHARNLRIMDVTTALWREDIPLYAINLTGKADIFMVDLDNGGIACAEVEHPAVWYPENRDTAMARFHCERSGFCNAVPSPARNPYLGMMRRDPA